MGVITRKKTTPNIRGLATRLRRSPNFPQARLKGPRIVGHAKAIAKKRTEPTRKSHPSDRAPETIHIPTARNTRANTIPKDRSEDSSISSALFKFSYIFYGLEFGNFVIKVAAKSFLFGRKQMAFDIIIPRFLRKIHAALATSVRNLPILQPARSSRFQPI